MGCFKFIETEIQGLFIIETKVFGDSRGYFLESYNYEDFKANGLDMTFVQDNQSGSVKNVLRGLHFQKNNPQGKLVRVLKGEVLDVVVDIRKGSRTFGKWKSVLLNEENRTMFYVPEGFAHGFVVMSDYAEFAYKCTNFYDPSDEGGLIWNDPDIGIDWKVDNLSDISLSDKDKKNPFLKEL
ncbi:MAG: dTDP-4-dehydrorhamnose 3,5-epimerase [Oscillospiraceae bacterium]|nr:dTDP-4-dehydrorhamnose 3,5-epimerase [Oscillospiraceae bacterium]